MAGINAIGQGEWSDAVSYYATAPPPAAASFAVASQHQAAITVNWTAPTVASASGDCAIEGYRVLAEDILAPGF